MSFTLCSIQTSEAKLALQDLQHACFKILMSSWEFLYFLTLCLLVSPLWNGFNILLSSHWSPFMSKLLYWSRNMPIRTSHNQKMEETLFPNDCMLCCQCHCEQYPPRLNGTTFLNILFISIDIGKKLLISNLCYKKHCTKDHEFFLDPLMTWPPKPCHSVLYQALIVNHKSFEILDDLITKFCKQFDIDCCETVEFF